MTNEELEKVARILDRGCDEMELARKVRALKNLEAFRLGPGLELEGSLPDCIMVIDIRSGGVSATLEAKALRDWLDTWFPEYELKNGSWFGRDGTDKPRAESDASTEKRTSNQCPMPYCVTAKAKGHPCADGPWWECDRCGSWFGHTGGEEKK